MAKRINQRGAPKPVINCCPECFGEGRIWDFEDPEEPSFSYCYLCQGRHMLAN